LIVDEELLWDDEHLVNELARAVIKHNINFAASGELADILLAIRDKYEAALAAQRVTAQEVVPPMPDEVAETIELALNFARQDDGAITAGTEAYINRRINDALAWLAQQQHPTQD
jgi:hypothetical protein